MLLLWGEIAITDHGPFDLQFRVSDSTLRTIVKTFLVFCLFSCFGMKQP
jgi:hypothetical protein